VAGLKYDLVLVHAPSIFDFRKRPIMFGPVSDVVPSTPVFEMYPIGFAVLADYLERQGFRVKIVNLALMMLLDKKFDPESYLRKIDTRLFGVDLHWLPHAQGAIEVAKLIKKVHPNTPIVFGGLSSSYFHRELIEFPFIDMVLKGDSTEEPFSMLLKVLRKNGFNGNRYHLSEVPNLTWKDSDGTVYCQPITYAPEQWNHSRINYLKIIQLVLRDKELKPYLPFKDFLRYPIVMSAVCRGGFKDCSICGGSRFAFKEFYGRKMPAVRSPEDLASDIYEASKYFNGPIFIVGDIQAPGTEYAHTFLSELKKKKVKNMIAFEFWNLPSKDILEMISESVENWSFEMSCESQDYEVRKKFGKAVYTNEQFKESLLACFKAGAQRGDVYFMTGIPYQTKDSILKIPEFVDELYEHMGQHKKKLVCFAAPLAPFLDPGSLAYEKPQYFGYNVLAKTLKQHIELIQKPSWKYWMNYESRYISRDDLVEATYLCGLMINEIKRKHGVIETEVADRVKHNIENAMAIMEKVDKIYRSGMDQESIERALKKLSDEMVRYSISTVCEKRELEWKVPSLRKFKVSNILRSLIGA
jgi:B12-binding domain/radical SAM domain protein